VIRKSGRSC